VFPQSFLMNLCVQLPGNRLLNKRGSESPPGSPEVDGSGQWWTGVDTFSKIPADALFKFRFISPLTGPHGRPGPERRVENSPLFRFPSRLW